MKSFLIVLAGVLGFSAPALAGGPCAAGFAGVGSANYGGFVGVGAPCVAGTTYGVVGIPNVAVVSPLAGVSTYSSFSGFSGVNRGFVGVGNYGGFVGAGRHANRGFVGAGGHGFFGAGGGFAGGSRGFFGGAAVAPAPGQSAVFKQGGLRGVIFGNKSKIGR